MMKTPILWKKKIRWTKKNQKIRCTKEEPKNPMSLLRNQTNPLKERIRWTKKNQKIQWTKEEPENPMNLLKNRTNPFESWSPMKPFEKPSQSFESWKSDELRRTESPMNHWKTEESDRPVEEPNQSFENGAFNHPLRNQLRPSRKSKHPVEETSPLSSEESSKFNPILKNYLLDRGKKSDLNTLNSVTIARLFLH